MVTQTERNNALIIVDSQIRMYGRERLASLIGTTPNNVSAIRSKSKRNGEIYRASDESIEKTLTWWEKQQYDR